MLYDAYEIQRSMLAGASAFANFSTSLLNNPTWVGSQNYSFMFTKDPFFWLAFRNTIWIIAIGVPLRIVFGIFTA